jgi:hypothetical protein
MSLPFLNTAPGYDEELRNSVFFERGLHATSIGAVGAAVAVAMLQGQDEAGIASAAAGIAASMGAGLLEANRTGGTVKRVHCGWAAHCGVAAAGPGPARAHRPADRAGGPLRVPAGVLRRPRPPEPPKAKARPASGYHAAFSGPCTVAAALLGGGLGVSHEDFTDAAARDPRRLALAALARCVEDLTAADLSGGALRSRQLPLPDCVGQVGHLLRRLRADRLQGYAARVHALEQADSGAEQHG